MNRNRLVVVCVIGALTVLAITRQVKARRVFDTSENSMFLVDYNPESTRAASTCSGPGRIFHVRDLTDTGWETGPTASGLTFDLPDKVTTDSAGNIYVSDRENRRVVRMTDAAGTAWKAFNGVGSNVLSQPDTRLTCVTSTGGIYGIALDALGRIYIGALNPQNLIRIDDMDGNGWTTFQLPGSNFFSPRVVTIDAQGHIYISDNSKNRLIRMNDMQGNGLITYGSYGNGVGQFNGPDGVAFDAQGRIYIADEYNHRLVRMNDITGAGWTTFGSFGEGVGQFSLPIQIRLDSLGRIYVTDTGNSRVVRMNSIAGDGWVAFGRSELQGRGFQFNANKGMAVVGEGPVIPFVSLFPQIAVGGAYNTSIIAINPTATPVNAITSLVQSGPGCYNVMTGCPQPLPPPLQVSVGQEFASAFARTIPAMGVMRLDATSAAALSAGYARLHSDEAAVHGIALYQAMSGNVIASEAGVGLSDPTFHFTVYIDNTNGAQTGYAMVNPKPEGIEPPATNGIPGGWRTLTLTLRDKIGTVLGKQSVTLAPGEHRAEFASQRFPDTVVPGFEGSIEIQTGTFLDPIQAVALRYDNAAEDVFTTVPVTVNTEDPTTRGILYDTPFVPVARSTKLHFPQIADGGTYQTDFILINTTDQVTTVTLQFFADDGTPLSLPIGGAPKTSLPVALPPRAVAHVVSDGTSSSIKAGWALATAPVYGVGGSAIFQTVVNGRITSEAGVSASPLAPHFFSYADSTNSAQSGVAICNPNNNSVTFTLNLRDASGQLLGSTTRTLAPQGHMAAFVGALFSGFSGADGVLEVVTNGLQLSVIALRYDNPGGTVFATTPVMAIGR
jgi:sugar lactone lactonase YvrE